MLDRFRFTFTHVYTCTSKLKDETYNNLLQVYYTLLYI